jgi:hypothetical protein
MYYIKTFKFLYAIFYKAHKCTHDKHQLLETFIKGADGKYQEINIQATLQCSVFPLEILFFFLLLRSVSV